MENWLPIKDYDEDYEVSDLGRVRSIKFAFKNILTPVDRKGYNRYILYRKGFSPKSFNGSVLVAMAFLGYSFDGNLVVDHINNNKKDDRLSNLQVISFRQNSNKSANNRTSNLEGVHWHAATNKWASQICVKYKKTYLGVFDTELQAHSAYKKALTSLSKGGEFELKRRGKSKYKNVTWNSKRQKWISKITINGKTIQVGEFYDEEKANLAMINFKSNNNVNSRIRS